jgi:hypothetical protein
MAETVSDLPSLLEALDTDDFNACSDVLKAGKAQLHASGDGIDESIDVREDLLRVLGDLARDDAGPVGPLRQARLGAAGFALAADRPPRGPDRPPARHHRLTQSRRFGPHCGRSG